MLIILSIFRESYHCFSSVWSSFCCQLYPLFSFPNNDSSKKRGSGCVCDVGWRMPRQEFIMSLSLSFFLPDEISGLRKHVFGNKNLGEIMHVSYFSGMTCSSTLKTLFKNFTFLKC